MKYEAIEEYRHEFSVRKMCEVLDIKESNYYRWRQRRQSLLEHIKSQGRLVQTIEDIFNEQKKVCGYRRMQKALKSNGIMLSTYKIRKIMRENGLYPETIKKYKPYHNGKTDGQFSPNIVNRNFKTARPNLVWAGDITYIKTHLGWVYLAVVIDLYNREVIGYAISKQIDTELVKRALGNALCGAENYDGVIFHSDRGCQYSSKGFQQMLAENGIRSSMSKPGCPFDNSCMESFFATLKKECIYRRRYVTMEEVKKDIFSYVELFYNRKRMHSFLGYLSPVEYRLRNQGGKTA